MKVDGNVVWDFGRCVVYGFVRGIGDEVKSGVGVKVVWIKISNIK